MVELMSAETESTKIKPISEHKYSGELRPDYRMFYLHCLVNSLFSPRKWLMHLHFGPSRKLFV